MTALMLATLLLALVCLILASKVRNLEQKSKKQWEMIQTMTDWIQSATSPLAHLSITAHPNSKKQSITLGKSATTKPFCTSSKRKTGKSQSTEKAR